MPVSMRRATVAIEDERFYKHDGVDLNAIVRAGVKNLESGETVQGGSTITQQLVRALYIKDPQRNFKRKIREAKLASELEERRSKTWILHQYLNSVPFGTVGGRTAIGVEAAAVTFFSKHARDLELHESALLAGLPQAPSQYNPFRNPQAALERRNEVLEQMAENGFITPHRGGRGGGREAEPRPGHPLQHQARAVLLRLRAGEADRALRRGHRACGRAAYLHHHRPADAGPGPRRRERVLRRSRGTQLGDRGRRPHQRQDPGDGLDRGLQGPHLQHRRPGPAPAGLGLQDLRAHRGGAQRRGPGLHHLHLQAPRHQRPVLRRVERQDLRRHLLGRVDAHQGHAGLRQLGLRPAHPRPGPEGGLPRREAAGHPDQARLLPGRGPRRPHARRHDAGDGRAPTARWPAAASATAPPGSSGWSSPTARARSSPTPTASG